MPPTCSRCAGRPSTMATALSRRGARCPRPFPGPWSAGFAADHSDAGSAGIFSRRTNPTQGYARCEVVGLHMAITPLFSRSSTGVELTFPPDFFADVFSRNIRRNIRQKRFVLGFSINGFSMRASAWMSATWSV